jgi:ribosomal protein S3
MKMDAIQGKLSDKEQTFARGIGFFYLDKYFLTEIIADSKEYYEAYAKTHKDIQQLGITQILYDEDMCKLTIVLHRPGIFIGEKGNNLYELEKYLQKKEPKLKISIVEARLNDFLYPIPYLGDEEL